jgi:hypothetical protein
MSQPLQQRRGRVQPDSVTEWAIALREPLKLVVIFTAFVFAVWLLVTATNPVGLAPLLGWALWQHPWARGSGSRSHRASRDRRPHSADDNPPTRELS